MPVTQTPIPPESSSSERRGVWLLCAAAFVSFFAASVLRHQRWSSTAHDLGVFDQVLFLLSLSQKPFCSIIGRHILADHASLILYPLSLSYRIYPSVYWLFGIQAAALSSGVIPLYAIARQRLLSHSTALSLAAIYVMHPTLLNSALFDFHPEVIAVPALLWVYYAIGRGSILLCMFAAAVALSCKEIIAVPVIALGISVVLAGERRAWGCSLIAAGFLSLVLTTSVLIPALSHGDFSSGFSRYAGLGATPADAAKTLLLHPSKLFMSMIDPSNLKYLTMLTLPFALAVGRRSAPFLLGALLIAMVNFLSPFAPQKSIDFHYSLLVLPLLALAAIAGTGRTARPSLLVGWALTFAVAYHVHGVYKRGDLYPHYWQGSSATQDLDRTLKQIPADASVLTNAYVAPHLSHRKAIDVFKPETVDKVEQFDYVLLPLKMQDVFCDSGCQVLVRNVLTGSPHCTLISEPSEAVLLFYCAQAVF